MIAFIIPMLLRLGLSPARADRFAKPVLIGIAILLLGGLHALALCSHDRGVIETHDATRDAQIATGARAADAAAAEEHRADDARIDNETEEVTHATQALPDRPTSARQHARACVILRQQARASGADVPAGC